MEKQSPSEALSLGTASESSNKGRDLEDSKIRKIIEDVRSRMFYVWRDRDSCSGVLAKLPESSVRQNLVLTSAGCISGNPFGRSRTVTTPHFKLSTLERHGHPRIADFLSEFLYPNGSPDFSLLRTETVEMTKQGGVDGNIFFNEDRMLAIYHDAWKSEARIPLGGIVHHDYFSLLRPVETAQGDGVQVILRQYDLAIVALNPDLETDLLKMDGLEIRGMPVHKEGDQYFAMIMTRDNETKTLNFSAKPVSIQGFSPKFGLIQTCEAPPTRPDEYRTHRSSALILIRDEMPYLIGLATFGSTSEKTIEGKSCVLTTFSHLTNYVGWLKLAGSEISERFSQR